MDVSRRNFLKGSAAALALAAAGSSSMALAGCGTGGAAPEAAASSEEVAGAVEETATSVVEEAAASAPVVDNTVKFDKVDVSAAAVDEVAAAIAGTGAVLVDARPWEAYAGWNLEGAANGGHLKGAKLFSNRWIDCDYANTFMGEGSRSAYLERSLKDQGLDAASEVIVYDYTGEQATTVAQYLLSKGVKNVKVFKANELIDAGSDLESYENHTMFLPTEIVKSISDVKTGKADELTPEAAAIIGDRIDKVLLFDVSWGNNFESGYLSAGHVPGSVHVNSDCYERPRVYVPEKRSSYAQEWRKIPIEEFRTTVAPQYGITSDSIAILSSNYLGGHARLGYYLKALGVETYAMVGGLSAWSYNGYELDTDPSTIVVPESVESFGSDAFEKIEYNTEDVLSILAGEAEGQVVDNRREAEWLGEYSGYPYHDLAGRIDGTIWCTDGTEDEGSYIHTLDNTPRTKEEYTAYFESCDIDLAKPVVWFCGDSFIASMIAWWTTAADMPNMNVWTQGSIPWFNDGREFIDHKDRKVHYDKYMDTVVDESGQDVRDGVNILDTVTE